MEEATRRKEGRNEEDSTSPSSSAGSKRRRFTEKTLGTGKFKGWAKSGIKLYNKINKMLERQRNDESLVDFEPTLKTWFLKGKNLSHSSTNDGGEDHEDSDEEDACNNFILKRRAMAALGQQHITQL